MSEKKYIGTEALSHIFSLLKGQFAQYAKTSDVSGAYATTALLNSTKETLEARDAAIEAKIPTDYVTTNNMTNYLTTEDAKSTYATKLALGQYLTKTAIEANYYNIEDTDELLTAYAKKGETITYDGPYASLDALKTAHSTGAAGTIYLVTGSGTSGDAYQEYIWATPTGKDAGYELIGTTADVDLSGYLKTEIAANTYATKNDTYTITETENAISDATKITSIKAYDTTLTPSSKVVTIPLATTSKAGLMSKDDKTNLNTFTNNTRGYITSSALSGYATTGNITSAVSAHNAATNAHSDIRSAIPTLTEISNDEVTSIWNSTT